MADEVEMTPIGSDELPPKAAPFGMPGAPAAAVPAAAAPAAASAATKPATIRLKPVIRKPVIRKPGEMPPAAPAAAASAPAATPAKTSTQSLKSITGAIPAAATLKKTGIIAEGILTPAQLQASKSKTSRISLESAIGVAPVSGAKSPAPLKTIRLRRPTDLNKPPAPSPFAPPTPAPAAPAAESAVAPLPPVEAADALAEADATVTQKKTLKLHRPGVGIKRPTMGLPVAAPSPAEGADEGLADLPMADDAFAAAPAAEGPKWLTAITLITSIAALLVLGATFYFLFTEGCGPVAGENVTAFIEM